MSLVDGYHQYHLPRRPQQFVDQRQMHSRTRTASSNVFPTRESSINASITQGRSPSTSTQSSIPARQNSTSSLGRSISSRSGQSANSYVALMRRQKATVWSDRAQLEDPRINAARRAAKERAAAEVTRASNARASTSGASSMTGRSKIGKGQQYTQSGLVVGGVPVRLSQNEIDDDEADDNSHAGKMQHRRTDSGRSSLGSTGRLGSMYGQYNGAQSADSTPPIQNASPPIGSADETPVPDHFRGRDYFSQKSRDKPEPASAEGSPDENSFGTVGGLPIRIKTEEEQRLSEADLRRRGSVDERTMTMSGGLGKLFIANPDA